MNASVTTGISAIALLARNPFPSIFIVQQAKGRELKDSTAEKTYLSRKASRSESADSMFSVLQEIWIQSSRQSDESPRFSTPPYVFHISVCGGEQSISCSSWGPCTLKHAKIGDFYRVKWQGVWGPYIFYLNDSKKGKCGPFSKTLRKIPCCALGPMFHSNTPPPSCSFSYHYTFSTSEKVLTPDWTESAENVSVRVVGKYLQKCSGIVCLICISIRGCIEEGNLTAV